METETAAATGPVRPRAPRKRCLQNLPDVKKEARLGWSTRERASGIYQITQLLPPEGEAFQYRVKNVDEPHERVAKENELRSA
jgi:hypothetical protein